MFFHNMCEIEFLNDMNRNQYLRKNETDLIKYGIDKLNDIDNLDI